MKYKIIKKRGRCGIYHWEILNLSKGDYQNINNKTFDSEKDAINYLKINKGE